VSIPDNISVMPVQDDYFGHATQKCRRYPIVDENHRLLGLVTRAEISQCHKEAPNSTLTECVKDQNVAEATSQETVKGRLAP
jgi:CBS-domain-containing membrane protein